MTGTVATNRRCSTKLYGKYAQEIGISIITKVKAFFRLRNVNIVGFYYCIYLIATCFGHTTMFEEKYIY
jgi:hypothetical protein